MQSPWSSSSIPTGFAAYDPERRAGQVSFFGTFCLSRLKAASSYTTCVASALRKEGTLPPPVMDPHIYTLYHCSADSITVRVGNGDGDDDGSGYCCMPNQYVCMYVTLRTVPYCTNRASPVFYMCSSYYIS